MLRFFRQIRQRLLTDNKFSKYLLNAVGEIALVVIGILIALQIDNWNAQQMERLEEIEILQSVRNDLENTIEEFRFLNQLREKIIDASKAIYQMASTQEIDEVLLDSLLRQNFFRPTFNNKQGTIDMLFQSGKINIIKNDSIREILIGWPGLIEDVVEADNNSEFLFENNYYPELSKYVVLNEILDKFFYRTFSGADTPVETFTELPIQNNFTDLLQQREWLNHLRIRAQYLFWMNRESEDQIILAQKLIEMIDKEIIR